MPSHNTHHLTWVSLTLDVGYLFMMLQQSAASAPYLGRGVSSHSCPSRMKGWSQSKNDTQLWMRLVIEARSNDIKSNTA